MFPTSYHKSPKAAITAMNNPPENPPASATAAAGVAVVVAEKPAADATDAVSTDSVAVAVGVVDLVELTTPLGMSDALNVPQTVQSSEPGLSWRHCSNVATQIEFGTDPV